MLERSSILPDLVAPHGAHLEVHHDESNHTLAPG